MTAVVATAMDWGESIVWRRVWGLSLTSWSFVVAWLAAFIGLLWDGAWHASWGRDTFFIPPHDLMYGAITIALGMAVGVLVTASRRPRAANFVHVGPLQAPLGIWIMLLGLTVMFTSAAYDDWWHTHIGHIEGDPVLWSPPHFLGLLGAITALNGGLLFMLREIAVPLRADGKPVWFWEALDAPNVALVLMFTSLAFLLSAISLDRFMIYDKLRFDGSVYPLLAMLLGPAALVLGQRITNRAGTATFSVLLGFVLAGGMEFLLKGIFGYPKAASLPIMALFAALLLDLAFKRFRRGYKWLLAFGPLFVLAFYATEYLWAWYLTRYPWWPIEKTLVTIPLGILIGTASLLAGAWAADRVQRVGWVHYYTLKKRA
jgi:hypothetical protein